MGYDIVIPLSDTSVNHDIELKYALRSMPTSQIFIIGKLPKWVKNVTHIPFTDIPNLRFKEQNIYNKLKVACEDPRISDPFIYANDDHFLLPGWDSSIYWHKGRLEPNATGPYNQTIKNTANLLGQCNNYDCHCPMLIHKDKFINIDTWPDWGYCMKTLYCVTNSIQGQYTTDCKINKPLSRGELQEKIEGRTWFSIGDGFFQGDGVRFLHSLYPNKSRFE